MKQDELANGPPIFLSTEFAGRREVRFVQAAVLISIVIFLAAVPFAKTPLTQIPAFIPIYDLFTSSITFAYALIFPGLFSPSGLFGAGPQTSSAR